MARTSKLQPTMIRFSAKLQRPANEPGSGHAFVSAGKAGGGSGGSSGGWLFLILPKPASAKLPSRSKVSVEGTINGSPFRATLEPDGQGGHWLKIDRKLREAMNKSSNKAQTKA